MKVYIYNENCVMAGRSVAQSVLDDHDGDPDDAGDWTMFEGTPKELRRLADTIDANNKPHFSVYESRKADTIRAAVQELVGKLTELAYDAPVD